MNVTKKKEEKKTKKKHCFLTDCFCHAVFQVFGKANLQKTVLLWFILIVNVRPLSVGFRLTVTFIYGNHVAICWEKNCHLGFSLVLFLF